MRRGKPIVSRLDRYHSYQCLILLHSFILVSSQITSAQVELSAIVKQASREARKAKLAMSPVKAKRKPSKTKAKPEISSGVQIDRSIEEVALLLCQ